MSFANSAAIAAAPSPVVSQQNPTLQMFEEFLDSFRAFSHALNNCMRAPAPLHAYAHWRPATLDDVIARAPLAARHGYGQLDDDHQAELSLLAQELDSRAVAAIVTIRRQQRRGTPHDMAFVESCRRSARALCESLRRFETALDPLLALNTTPAPPSSVTHHAPTLELITNVTMG